MVTYLVKNNTHSRYIYQQIYTQKFTYIFRTFGKQIIQYWLEAPLTHISYDAKLIGFNKIQINNNNNLSCFTTIVAGYRWAIVKFCSYIYAYKIQNRLLCVVAVAYVSVILNMTPSRRLTVNQKKITWLLQRVIDDIA